MGQQKEILCILVSETIRRTSYKRIIGVRGPLSGKIYKFLLTGLPRRCAPRNDGT